MARKKLTAMYVENLKPNPEGRVEIADIAMPGLYCVVQPTGAKSWALRYRHEGKPRKFTIGPFPAFGLAEAREEAAKALRQLSEGRDPAELRKAEIEAAKATADEAVAAERDKLARVLEDFITRHTTKRRSGAETAATLRREVLTIWGEKRVQDVTRRDVIELLDAVVDRGAPIAANRLRAHLSVFFAWCAGRGVIDRNPVEGTPKPAEERTRDRVLTDAEIALFWGACDKIGQPFCGLFKTLLLTGQRLREVSNMTEAEVEGGLWIIPPARAKNGAEHAVPLSPLAVETLEAVPRIAGARGWVFSTSGNAPVSGFSKAKTRLDAAMSELAQDAALGPVLHFTLHDLRRTAATGMASIRIAPHVVEAVLNHRSGTRRGVAGVYNRHDHLDEKREALAAWAGRVAEIIGRQGGDNVIKIAARNG